MSRLLPVLALLAAGCAFVPDQAVDDRLDHDGDGSFAAVFGGDDCDDDDATVHPGATDSPGDALDQDCDGAAFCPAGDADADGVCDGADRCGLGPDDVDSDADGVPDACDQCADADDAEDLDDDASPDRCDDDDDGDDVADVAEIAYGSDPRVADTDGDGVDDGVENANHDGVFDLDETDAVSEDTDFDGLCDGDVVVSSCVGAEELQSTDPLNYDTDDDGLDDGEEVDRTGTSPLLMDSDFDGIIDGVEDRTGTDPTADDTDGDGLDDGEEDADWDGVLDGAETDPRLADSDGDGLDDPDETESDPRDPDTDADGVLDGDEARGDFDDDGQVDARDKDSDADGLDDGAEVAAGTGLRDADSDDDGLRDGPEVGTWGSSPLLADTDADGLGDGYEVETSLTEPTVADTDADGLDDGAEVDLGSDPLDRDTDDDSLSDGAEGGSGSDPLDPDSDGNGVCDGPRTDGDGDGVDPVDACRWVWFVDASAAPNGDGRSWATAFDAPPSYAVAGDNDVWVRAGTYRAKVAGDAVLAPEGAMRVFGGFAGTEVAFADRPAVLLPTVLDGDRDLTGGPTVGDSTHVIWARGGAVIDGFTVQNGNASSGGAGLYADGAQGLLVRDVAITDGYTTGSGGCVYARFADLTLQGVQIANCQAGIEAGGLYVQGGAVDLVDVEITANRAPLGAGLVVRLGALHVDQVWVHQNRTPAGIAGGGGAFLGATVDGTGLVVETNDLNDAPPCSASPVLGGGGLYIGSGSNVTIDGGSVSRNTAAQVGGICLANASLTLRGSTLYDNTGINAVYVADGGNLTVQDSELVGSSVSIVHASGTNARVQVVDSAVQQRSSVISLNLQVGSYARVTGSSLYGAVYFGSGFGDAGVSHSIVYGLLSLQAGDVADHTAATGLSWPGTGNAAVVGDPFVRLDRDADGAPELYLKHVGLDAQVSDGPGVDGGDAAVLDPLLAPYAIDWRAGTTRSDGALDGGAPDLGRHY